MQIICIEWIRFGIELVEVMIASEMSSFPLSKNVLQYSLFLEGMLAWFRFVLSFIFCMIALLTIVNNGSSRPPRVKDRQREVPEVIMPARDSWNKVCSM